jgi:hypothetical protein
MSRSVSCRGGTGGGGQRGDAAESGFPYANDGAELADSRKRQAEFAQRRKRLEKEMQSVPLSAIKEMLLAE